MNLQYIKRIGPKIASQFEALGLFTTEEALYYFPSEYHDRRVLPTFSDFIIGEKVWVIGVLGSFKIEGSQKFAVVRSRIQWDGNSIDCVWFNQRFVTKSLKLGMQIVIVGKIQFNELTCQKELHVIEYEKATSYNHHRVVPIYSLVKGITQNMMRYVIWESLTISCQSLVDPYPISLRQRFQLMELKQAIQLIHYPTDRDFYKKARGRIVFDDFFYMQLAIALHRRTQIGEQGIVFAGHGRLRTTYVHNMPYTLTNAQQRVIEDVLADMRSPKIMNRLIQGDVGSGKTEVAVAAILEAVECGFQVAVMAPTEILASQHYQKLSRAFLSLNIRVGFLSGSLKIRDKKAMHEQISHGLIDVAIGTHALIQSSVTFNQLGLAIIDEQHRFGVLQRAMFKQKSFQKVDFLVLTATPIPRSLSLTLYGELDKSIIDELPPGRTPIQTQFITPSKRKYLYERVKAELRSGQQVYIVFPLVEISEKIDLKAAVQEYETLKIWFLPWKVGLIHGKLKPIEKDRVMTDFKNGILDILIATTVIEVGVDVPQASIMIIEHAERFGLAQLHQLRGRVGRGAAQSYCYLVAKPKSADSRKRMTALCETTDGFKLAEIDLSIRGPGDYYGTKQSGLPSLLMANLIKDERILLEAKKMADYVVGQDASQYPLLYQQHQRRKVSTVIRDGMN